MNLYKEFIMKSEKNEILKLLFFNTFQEIFYNKNILTRVISIFDKYIIIRFISLKKSIRVFGK